MPLSQPVSNPSNSGDGQQGKIRDRGLAPAPIQRARVTQAPAGRAIETIYELPKYVSARWSSSKRRYGFYFQVPSWARKRGCRLISTALGHDIRLAIEHGQRLADQFEQWRLEGAAIEILAGPRPNSLDWVVQQYRKHRNYAELQASSRRAYEGKLKILLSHVFSGGRYAGCRFGDLPYTTIDEALVDTFIDEILYQVVVEDCEGKPVSRTIKRRSRTRNVIAAAGTMWNQASLKIGRDTLGDNPFSAHRIRHQREETEAATLDELADCVLASDMIGCPIVGTLLLAEFEIAWRPDHLLRRFMVEHYRPSNRPDEMMVLNAKSGTAGWMRLFDDGKCLFPALVSRLDALKGSRSQGLMFQRKDDAGHKPIPETWIRSRFKDVALAAGYPHLTPTTFRHGGLTEMAEAQLTEYQIGSLSLHKNFDVIKRHYWHLRQSAQVKAQKQRNAHRASSPESRGVLFVSSATNDDQLTLDFA